MEGMLEKLEQFGRQFGRDLARTLGNVADGWRELMSRSANALTRFTRKDNGNAPAEVIPADAPRWGVLAGDLVDTDSEIVVRLELPGVAKEDCEISVEAGTLYVRGEKRFDSSYVDGVYHVRQCAYGVFERALPLPRQVRTDAAEAHFHNGVLVVRLPKVPGDPPQRVRIA